MQIKENYSSALFKTNEDSPGILSPVLGTALQESYKQIRKSSNRNEESPEKHDLQRKELRTFSLEKRTEV